MFTLIVDGAVDFDGPTQYSSLLPVRCLRLALDLEEVVEVSLDSSGFPPQHAVNPNFPHMPVMGRPMSDAQAVM